MNNPKLFDSPIAFEFESLEWERKPILRIWVPPSPNMHRFKGDIFERIEDSDVVVRSASRLAKICIRKQGLYTEQRVYKHIAMDDLKFLMRLLSGNKNRVATVFYTQPQKAT